MHERRDAERRESRLEGYRKGGFRIGEMLLYCRQEDKGQLGGRTGRMQDWRELELEGFKTGGIQDWRAGGIQDWRDGGKGDSGKEEVRK